MKGKIGCFFQEMCDATLTTTITRTAARDRFFFFRLARLAGWLAVRLVVVKGTTAAIYTDTLGCENDSNVCLYISLHMHMYTGSYLFSLLLLLL